MLKSSYSFVHLDFHQSLVRVSTFKFDIISYISNRVLACDLSILNGGVKELEMNYIIWEVCFLSRCGFI